MLTNLSSIAHLEDGGRWCVDTTRCNCCWCRRVCRGLVPGCWEPEAGWRVWRGYRSSVPVVEWCYTVEDLYNIYTISTQYLHSIYTISTLYLKNIYKYLVAVEEWCYTVEIQHNIYTLSTHYLQNIYKYLVAVEDVAWSQSQWFKYVHCQWQNTSISSDNNQ